MVVTHKTNKSTNQKMSKIPVGILGATGMVGQRFIQLLASHPLFRIEALGASERSAGKTYQQATDRRWKLDTPIPPEIAALPVVACTVDGFKTCKLVFSGLDSDVAGEVELAFLKAEIIVFSNAKNYRMDADVPLMVPLVNTSHYSVIPFQRKNRNLKSAFLVTNANCATTGMVVVLKALQDAFGPMDKCMISTMQAISGAGYPGVASMDILGNVVPFISGEEDKLEIEPQKILGDMKDGVFVAQKDLVVSAMCHRVPVIDGHLETLSLSFVKRPAPSVEAIQAVLEAYTCEAQALQVPSAPAKAIQVMTEVDRPQPRLDRNVGNGNTITVGRIRKCPLFDVKLVLLSHNTIIGAASSSIMNAEVAVKKGLISA